MFPSHKRPLEDVSDDPEREIHSDDVMLATKRARRLPEPETESESDEEGRTTNAQLPPPANMHIELRFQLYNFKGVHRIVRVPMNYTFAHLHLLNQFIFGWSGCHAHRFEVWSDIELYSGNYKSGHIKKMGTRPLPRDDLDDDEKFYQLDFRRWENAAIYDVAPRGCRKHSNRNRPTYNSCKEIDETELTIGQVWSYSVLKNASKGLCTNKAVGVTYEYDFGSNWIVHITLDKEYGFYKAAPPTNWPVFMTCKGAPPIEDTDEEINETEAHKKTIPARFYEADAFSHFIMGRLRSCAGHKSLEVEWSLGGNELEQFLKERGKTDPVKTTQLPRPNNADEAHKMICNNRDARAQAFEDLEVWGQKYLARKAAARAVVDHVNPSDDIDQRI
ncbi:hypothetical protein FISHEDRAFT_77192 [Fistulina hepatica ATCC 64428]|uniref:Plasmid pRiA4b Orf3-like domain-containing protein n=1 Tax=Fistulina hepatica ATCC 64428 TaxID=1128425 RepID=A0A0D7A1T3_9AGAR|nr:hypothetical protein FISHEDRAFT_77192 [Fistulina hepatica ATCC 64428]